MARAKQSPRPRLKEGKRERRMKRGRRKGERAHRPLDTDEETPTPIDSVDLGILPRSPAGFAIARAIPFLTPIIASRSRDVPPRRPRPRLSSHPRAIPRLGFCLCLRLPVSPLRLQLARPARFLLFRSASRVFYWIYLLRTVVSILFPGDSWN